MGWRRVGRGVSFGRDPLIDISPFALNQSPGCRAVGHCRGWLSGCRGTVEVLSGCRDLTAVEVLSSHCRALSGTVEAILTATMRAHCRAPVGLSSCRAVRHCRGLSGAAEGCVEGYCLPSTQQFTLSWCHKCWSQVSVSHAQSLPTQSTVPRQASPKQRSVQPGDCRTPQSDSTLVVDVEV